jgi:hypothetical protein
MLSVYVMYRRFARALKIAAREEGFAQPARCWSSSAR